VGEGEPPNLPRCKRKKNGKGQEESGEVGPDCGGGEKKEGFKARGHGKKAEKGKSARLPGGRELG